MKDIIYFRGRRVASTAIQNWLKSNPYMNMWTNQNHYRLHVTKKQCIEDRGVDFWNNTTKIVCVRNVFINSVSMFLHHKVDCKPNGQIEENKLRQLIERYRQEVKHAWSSRNDKKTIARQNLIWHFDRQRDIYTIDNHPEVDFYINYEVLDESIDQFYKSVLDDHDLTLRKTDDIANNLINTWKLTKNKYDPRKFFDRDTYKMVQEMRSTEIDQFDWYLDI